MTKMPRPARQVQRAVQMTRAFGPGWLALRASYALQLRLGVLQRRLPLEEWSHRSLRDHLSDPALADPTRYLEYRRHGAPRFFFAPGDRARYAPLFSAWDAAVSVAHTPQVIASDITRGQFRYFESECADIGFPPAWHANPFTGQSVSADHHWSRISDFESGDIKVIWEPGRFAFAFALVRAFWRDGDEAHAEVFWQLLESWREHNPPQRGPHWKCGQETALRLMAWCFALHGFLDCAATTPARAAMLAETIALLGERIAANLNYALRQQNNHGISEGMGLWTIGALFPEFKKAAQWSEMGRRALENQGRALIYDDGAFAQHSVNYHRLMLHDYLWCLHLAELQGQPLSNELKERVTRAGEFLHQIQDETTGQVPLYGANDGALILPLNNCGHHDFRPVVGAVRFLAHGARAYECGPWDEDLLWLFGPQALAAPTDAPPRRDLNAATGGYYTLRAADERAADERAADSFVFTRCATFRHRPGQADLLHADVWWRGQNIACDAGTNSYNSPPPWNNPFARTAPHNTVSVDGLDQMERVGPFLWLPWPHGHMRARFHSPHERLAWWEGEHDGYGRLKPPVAHRRGILRLGEEHWLVLDKLSSAGEHDYRLHWLLPDYAHEWDAGTGTLQVQTPPGAYRVRLGIAANATGRKEAGEVAATLVRADEKSPRGWRSRFYGQREPALSLALEARASTLLFWTVLGPHQSGVTTQAEGERITLSIEAARWQACVQLQKGNAGALISAVRLKSVASNGVTSEDGLTIP